MLGLLPLLKSIQKPTHLRNFSGQTLGIDAYGWLHRGTVGCAIELAQGKPTRKHIDFALHRVRMLLHFGVKPYVVFDGAYLPSKAHTEKGRAARRRESKRVGLDLLRMGRTNQAQQELQKAVDVTAEMARELIEELKRMDIAYVVAPFEADSQLAYLEKQGIINGVISEDSDLLVFGVKCLLTKLDQYGECIMIQRTDFTACREVSFVGWTDAEFRMMAILSGCDYLPGIKNLGLKTAYRLVRKHKALDKLIQSLRFDGKKQVPLGYLESFTNAERTFLYQWVFCPRDQCLRNLNPLPAGLSVTDMPFLGKEVDAATAASIASGDLDPNTKQPIIIPQRYRERETLHRTVSTPIEKCGKPITEFFRRRTPLADLDPNSFTPSPSQQRLLQTQQNASWSAASTRTPGNGNFFRDSMVAMPSSAPQPSTRATADILMPPPTEAFKRGRLCSDSAISSAMTENTDAVASTSRFFAKRTAHDSPNARKQSRRSQGDEFELWSDDSVADALAEVVACAEGPHDGVGAASKKRKKLSIYLDAQAMPISTSAQKPTPRTMTSDAGSPLIKRDLERTPSSALAVPKPALAAGSSPRIRAAMGFVDATPNQPARRLIDKAMDRDREPPTPLDTGVQVIASPETVHSQMTKTLDVAKFVLESAAVIDNTRRQETELFAQSLSDETRCLGSEDLLVPNSPEIEDDPLENRIERKKLDLGHFVFAG